nr:circularly permuted type 2 ATP-grasp protein [Nocardia takedensis]
MNHETAQARTDVLEPGHDGQDAVGDPMREHRVTRAELAAQYARYRAESGASGAYDECGRPIPAYYDELVDAGGSIRPMWSELSDDFAELGTAGLGRLDTRVRRLIEDDGITYTEVGGTGDTAPAVPWRLDPIPLLISAEDWTKLEAGLTQRSRVLDEVLTDLYGPRRTLTTGLLPPEIVFGSTGYVRAAHGITIPGRHQLFLHACDISRWGDGQFRVLADWAQAPSGAGYALADRRVVSTAIPESFEHAGPRPLTPFARAMRLLLIEAAPVADSDDPMVVVLSPGVHSETAFDQAYLAATLGFPLVESADLVVREGALWMRSLGTLKRVEVVLRRVDSAFSDPLDLRPDSQLGVVGLVEVLRRGAVTVVNTLGSGLLESPALPGFLPRLSRALLGEELLLDSTPSYWAGENAEKSHLLANLDRLVIRSAVDGHTLFGPGLNRAEREELAARIETNPWQWVGQEPAQFSVAPSVQGYGELSAAPVGMRLFSMARRGGYTAMAGGLGQLRHRLEPDRSVIKVAAKDLWVRAAPTQVTAVSAEPHPEERLERLAPVVEAISSPRVLNDLFWMGRYSERAEAVVRLLIATHDSYQDYRFRPWLDGAEAVPVLVSALARSTGTIAPAAVVLGPPRPTPPVPQQSSPLRAEPEGEQPVPPDASAPLAGGQSQFGAGQSQSNTDESQAGFGQSQSQSGPGQPNVGQSQSGSGQSQSSSTRSASFGEPPERTEQTASGRPATASGEVAGEESAGAGESPSEDLSGPDASISPADEQRADDSRDEAASDVSGSVNDERDDSKTAGGALIGAALAPIVPERPARRGRSRKAAPGSREGYEYLVALTIDRELPGSLAFAIDRYGSAARAVRDQLSQDTWMILSAVDRALAEYRAADENGESALTAVHSLTLAALLSLSGIGGESLVRDTGWYVMDIGKRIERGLALTAVLSSALTRVLGGETERVVTEAVLRATESSVSYRRRHRDSVRVSSVAALLLFDASNPRSLAYQLDRLDEDFQQLPGASGSSRPQRLLADAQRMLRRLDPADLEVADEDGKRAELAELLEGVHLRLRKVSESFETTKLSLPVGIQPLWGSTRVVG